MAEHPIWAVGARDPSITETLTDGDGNAVDLNDPASTIKFQAREAGSSTFLVDAAAVIVQTGSGGSAVNKGAVRYDWTAADAQTTAPIGALGEAHSLLVRWEVTRTGTGKKQYLAEAIIRVDQAAPLTHAYIEVEELKSASQLTGTTFEDLDIQEAIMAASRAVDEITGQFFWIDADANQVRYYTAELEDSLRIDPLTAFTSLLSDDGDDGTFETTWVRDTDFVLEPVNAPTNSEPWNRIRILSAGNYSFPSYPNRIKLTGKFGWADVPANVKLATGIIAKQLVLRKREAPFGILSLGLEGVAIRIGRSDPQVDLLLRHYTQRRMLV